MLKEGLLIDTTFNPLSFLLDYTFKKGPNGTLLADCLSPILTIKVFKENSEFLQGPCQEYCICMK
jgi:hypothetical protein